MDRALSLRGKGRGCEGGRKGQTEKEKEKKKTE